MSDFCKQCSYETFGEDFCDLANIAKPGELVHVLCEGCANALVNSDGRCVSNCLKNHIAKQD